LADTLEEFAEAINRLLQEPNQYQELRKNARTFVEQNYSWNVFVRKLNEAIKEI